MRKILFAGGALAAASLMMADPAMARNDTLRGAAIGAGGGAVAGAVIPGLSVGEGAVIGGVAGAVIGATSHRNHSRWYRDRHGRSYWVDRRGRRHYR